MNKRYEILDGIKGVGMISVIIGHSVAFLPLTHLKIGYFVYLYHLMVFFFSTGFLYDEKYNDNISVYLGKRAYGIIKPFVLYNAFFVIIHNILIRLGLIAADAYDFNMVIIRILSGCVLNTSEDMLGAFWFLPVLLISCAFFGVSFLIADKISILFHKSKVVKYIVLGFIVFLFAVLGIFSNQGGLYLSYHMQTSILAMPIMFAGWVVKKNMQSLEKLICIWGLIISGVLLFSLVHFNVLTIELAVNQLGNMWLFYPVTLVGIYFCLCISKVVIKIPGIGNGLKFIGKNSFHFMALHFIVFKILDRIISLIKGDDISVANVFPHSYDLGLIYTVVAVLIIVAVVYIGLLLKKKVVDGVKKINEKA